LKSTIINQPLLLMLIRFDHLFSLVGSLDKWMNLGGCITWRRASRSVVGSDLKSFFCTPALFLMSAVAELDAATDVCP